MKEFDICECMMNWTLRLDGAVLVLDIHDEVIDEVMCQTLA